MMNTKAKGSRRERQARDLLYSWGALRVVKSGASLGEFDLLALFPGELICIQAKANRWPSHAEMARLKDFPRLTYLKKLIFRYRDGVGEPDVLPFASVLADRASQHSRRGLQRQRKQKVRKCEKGQRIRHRKVDILGYYQT